MWYFLIYTKQLNMRIMLLLKLLWNWFASYNCNFSCFLILMKTEFCTNIWYEYYYINIKVFWTLLNIFGSLYTDSGHFDSLPKVLPFVSSNDCFILPFPFLVPDSWFLYDAWRESLLVPDSWFLDEVLVQMNFLVLPVQTYRMLCERYTIYQGN